MKINHIIKTGAFLIFFQFLSYVVLGQAVFAPKIGAEWHYQVFYYPYTYPNYPQLGIPTNGNLSIRYTKDTLIGGLKMKKFEQNGKFKYITSDTLHTYTNPPFFMIQRNDSVFMLVNDTLTIAFVYKTQVGNNTIMKSYPRKYIFNLQLKYISDTFSINNNNFRLKKYTYSLTTNPIIFDVYFTNPLIILDRIGAINAHLTVLNSQGQSSNYVYDHYLMCYQDDEVGELKFSTTDCNGLVSVRDLETLSNDFKLFNQVDALYLSLKNNDNEFIKKVKVYDYIGRLVWHKSIINNQSDISILKSDLPQGILIINLESNKYYYKAKKIINHH